MILYKAISGILILILLLKRKRLSKTAKKTMFVMLLTSMAGIAIGFREQMTSVWTDGAKIERNEAGEGDFREELQIWADGILEGYTYTLDVPEQILTESEEQAYLKAAQEEIAEEFSGENESVDCIRTKAVVRSSYQKGKVAAEWLFADYDLIDAEGNITAEDLPEEGVLTEAAVGLSCGGSECEYRFPFRVFPSVRNEQEQFLKILKDTLKREGERQGEAYFNLPGQIGGYAVTWIKPKEHTSEKILLLGIALAIFIPLSEQSKRREKQKERERQLQLEYPDMVSKLALLLGAGMTVGGAWKRIVSAYQKKQERQNGRDRPVYEEMLFTMHETESGVGEERAYLRFGERCGLQKYRRFSGMLVRNLKKGNREMAKMLLQESETAFEERKSLAKRYGEEAGTKLLVPMILQLGVLMAILLVPALLSFQL